MLPTTMLAVSPALQQALAEGRPAVALETSIVAHGLPWPLNLAVADAMAAAVERSGATPGYTGVADGRLWFGLERRVLETFARSVTAKASARDLARCATQGLLAATTVAGTLRIARALGVRVMATGGIGGVHRDAGSGLDVSADLGEIASTPALVIASGAKSILDLPRTLEWLEMLGVPVIGWRTDRFPAFYVADSGLVVPRLDDLEAVAAMASAHWAMGGGGILLVQPSPQPLAPEAVDEWTATALREAAAAGTRGGDVTPFLLATMARESQGATLRSNEALAVANADLAGRLAVVLTSRLARDGIAAYSSRAGA